MLKRRLDSVKETLKKLLEDREEILFAYLHGSFLHTEGYRDVDVAVYVDPKKVSDFMEYELELSVELEAVVGLPIDVKVLNSAPPAFRYRVLSGELLFVRDERSWLEFYDLTVREYLDFKPFEKEMMREMLHSGS